MKNMPLHPDEDHPSLRNRRPNGFFGALAYLTDHLVFRFKAPVDWRVARFDIGCDSSVSASAEPRLSLLNHREVVLLRYMAQGLTTVEMAEALGVAKHAIDEAVGIVQEKLGLHRLTDIRKMAVKSDLL